MSGIGRRLSNLERILIIPKIDGVLEQEANAMKASFHAFVKAAWPLIEGCEFVDNWHIGALCEHLEAVHRLEIKKLIINVPPRTSKSSITTIMWPVWTWIDNPELQYFCVSHSDRLVKKHGVQSRDIVTSEWFRSRWGGLFSIKPDQNTQNRYVNSRLGFRESCGILSKFTGSGGQRIIIDDPNNAEEYTSERVKVNEKYSGSLSTRINNPKEAVWVLIQQRTHEKDLTGHIIENDLEKDWVRFILPMEFESSRRCVTVALPSNRDKPWADPRTQEGELLWSERFDRKKVEQTKRELGSYRYASQYQQRPSPEEGGIIKKHWFRHWKGKDLPVFSMKIQSWDTALSASESASYSACTTWGVFNHPSAGECLLLLSLWRGKVEYHELLSRMKALYVDYKLLRDLPRVLPLIRAHKIDLVLVEEKSSGYFAINELRKMGVPANGFDPRPYGDKLERIRRASALIESGKVFIADHPALAIERQSGENLIEQSVLFPNGESRDVVDTMSQVLLRLRDNGYLEHKLDQAMDLGLPYDEGRF